MGGIRELLDGKIWDLSFRWEWEWDGNEVIEMGGNWYEKSVLAHLHSRGARWSMLELVGGQVVVGAWLPLPIKAAHVA